jgi:hypothetical protein
MDITNEDTKQNEWDLFLKNVSEVTGKDVQMSFSVNGKQKDLGAIDTKELVEELSGDFIAKMDLTIHDKPDLVQRRSSTQTAAAVAAADLYTRSENTFIESVYIFLIIVTLTCFMLGVFYMASFIV